MWFGGQLSDFEAVLDSIMPRDSIIEKLSAVPYTTTPKEALSIVP